MSDTFKPYSFLNPNKKPTWQTPDFNPYAYSKTGGSIIKEGDKKLDTFNSFGSYVKKNVKDYLKKLATTQGLTEELLGGAGVGGIAGHIKPKEIDKFYEEMLNSTIRNKQGDLVPVYHAGESIEKGLPTRGTGIYSEGVYFSGIPERTHMYGEKASQGTTYPMYANIKNPISGAEFTKRFGYANAKNSKKIRDTLVAEGYDGVISKLGDDVWEGVSFFPENQLISSVSSITPKMKDEMLKKDVQKFNKY